MLSVFLVALWPTSGFASGPGVGGRRVRLDNQPAGPFLLRAVTSPTPPTIENFNVEVKVLAANTGVDVLDAEVVIMAEAVDFEAAVLQETATHDFAPLPTEYAAHLAIPEVGLWLITINVESDLGNGEVSFYQQISNPPNLGAWVSVGAPVSGLLLLVLIFFWLQRNSARMKDQSDESSDFLDSRDQTPNKSN
jgi:hypothetical protein